MKFLHFDVWTKASDVIRVDLNGAEATVRVMDESNFRNYESGGQHQYYGGCYRQSPAFITPPSGGHWHVVVDPAGGARRVEARVSVLQSAVG
jgi:hypothetical protein